MNDYFSSFHTFRHYQECIEQNFDVSVVIPFYKKLKAFKRVFPRNRKYFERNGIEVIIVMVVLKKRTNYLLIFRDFHL